jgi:hypothetical protein
LFVIDTMLEALVNYNIHINPYLTIVIITLTSIFVGMLSTYKVEKYFLSIRDKYYPSRIN